MCEPVPPQLQGPVRRRVKNVLTKKVPLAEKTNDCPICFEKLASKPLVKRLPCSHLFHVQCINKWTETKRRHRCPICRANYRCVPVCSYHASGAPAQQSEGRPNLFVAVTPLEEMGSVRAFRSTQLVPRSEFDEERCVRFRFAGSSRLLTRVRALLLNHAYSRVYVMLHFLALRYPATNNGYCHVLVTDDVVREIRNMLLTVG